MASRKTLNARNLEALGAPRLAELLMEISAGDAEAKRCLRLALASSMGTSEVAKEIRKRLTTIAKSRSFVDWQKRDALIRDLETQLDAIVNQVAPTDPREALDLLWRFLGLAESIYERCDDSNGSVSDVFHFALTRMGPIAESAGVAPDTLADCTYDALVSNDYGQYDDLIKVLSPALGERGLAHLKERLVPRTIARTARTSTRTASPTMPNAKSSLSVFEGRSMRMKWPNARASGLSSSP